MNIVQNKGPQTGALYTTSSVQMSSMLQEIQICIKDLGKSTLSNMATSAIPHADWEQNSGQTRGKPLPYQISYLVSHNYFV